MPAMQNSNMLALSVALLLWSLPWKGIALWKAARRDQWLWYVILLVVNTVGLLEIAYIFMFSRRQPDLAEQALGDGF